MKPFTRQILALAVAASCATGAMAQALSKAEYRAKEATIESDYKTASSACDVFSAQAKRTCSADAKGRKKVALAELRHSAQPGVDTRYKAHIARAEAAYSLAREQCNAQTGNAKDVCVKEAQAADTAARADALAQMKTSEANNSASSEKAAIQTTAAQDKNTALYQVAIQKCDVFVGAIKANCLAEAKQSYGK